jgi:hypothetical protein
MVTGGVVWFAMVCYGYYVLWDGMVRNVVFV